MSEAAKIKRINAMAINLYEAMPGAEQPPRDERGKLWGEVEHTPHYEFCHLIAALIVGNPAATFVEPD
jgi:hypothetical protein